jgi:Activator of Hsp90 ATPase homolog 1-like protein
MSEAADSLAPLRKTVVVPVGQSHAFELFTARIGQWWPLATHSVGLDDAVLVSFPSEVGGSIVETMRDGRTSVWGAVTAWDPPVGISFTWHPGQPESWAGDIEVRFIPDSSGGTLVELTHSGWERRSDGAAARLGYDSGWDVVVGAYGARASSQ